MFPSQPSAVAEQLGKISLFSELSPEEIAHVVRFTRPCTLAKGEILFERGDPSRGFYILLCGQIKLTMLSKQGQEKIVEIIHPLQSFGEAVMLLERPYPVSAEALMPARLLHVSHAIVAEMIDSDPRFTRKLLAGMAIRLHRLIRDVETYSLRSSAQRVIGYLLQLVPEASPANRCVVTLPATKQAIASRLNLTPETLSRVLHELSDAGLITVRREQVHIHDNDRLSGYY